MSLTQAEPLMTPAEVGALFRVDPKTVTRWAKSGKLTSVRTPGGHRRYRETEVKTLLAATTLEPEPNPLRAPARTLWPSSVMPPVIRGRFKAAGIATVGNLTALTADGLRELGLRAPQVDEVRLVLCRKGLALHGEVADKAA